MHQYVQHDWSPVVWATCLATMAVATLLLMGLFIWLVAGDSSGSRHKVHDIDLK